jgi:hypothetical protein
MFLPNGDSFTGEWRRGLIGGTLVCVCIGLCCAVLSAVLFVVSMSCHATLLPRAIRLYKSPVS